MIDQVMYFVSFLVAIASGLIINQIQNATVRRLFSTYMGFLIQIYMYGKGKLQNTDKLQLIIFRFLAKPFMRLYFLCGNELLPQEILTQDNIRDKCHSAGSSSHSQDVLLLRCLGPRCSDYHDDEPLSHDFYLM